MALKIKNGLHFLVALVFLPTAGISHADDTITPPSVKRGAYIEKLGDCSACHTAPGGKPFAGGKTLMSPFGPIVAANITPDKTYGIGNYSLEDFKNAVRNGITRDGDHLYPAMPYPSFSKMSDQDIADLYTFFMKSVQPVSEKPPETDLQFPFNQRWGLIIWNYFFMPDDKFEPRKDKDQRWNRGAYLVKTLGHCGACHTPRDIFYKEKSYTDDSSSFLSGGTMENWHAPDLRADPATGLGRWSEGDIARFLKTGHGAGTTAFGQMKQAIEDSTQYMTAEDRTAIAHYLKSLAPSGEKAIYAPHNREPESPDGIQREKPGAGIYMQFCAKCHEPDGSGKPPLVPGLAGNPAVLSKDPSSVIHIILKGGKSPETITGPQPKEMPSFDTRFTDREIADVATFIRQSWGNKSSAIDEKEVTDLREAIEKTKYKKAQKQEKRDRKP